MPDFPGVAQELPHVNLSTIGPHCPAAYAAICNGVVLGGVGVWPGANRAIYVGVQIDVPVTVVKMAFQVAVQAGNYDVGIYDEHGNRLVSKGSTLVPVAGIAITDITDTVLMPGYYWLAMCVSSTTASFQRFNIAPAGASQVWGVETQAVGAVTLPDPATFSGASLSGYVPMLVAMTVLTL